ncbi:MAG: septum formation initiator family protein [Candidatus Aminicenantes bacterium]|jgi:cell division protein FtsB|nr:septum formation initiator family protein [Candidatus Aminicenantes bacterium]
MRKKEKDNISFRRKLLIAGLGFFFLVLLLASFFGKKGLIEIYRARKEHETLLQEIDRFEIEKRRLEKEIEELKQNPKAVEKKAREKLWLVKPDEVVIIKKEK